MQLSGYVNTFSIQDEKNRADARFSRQTALSRSSNLLNRVFGFAGCFRGYFRAVSDAFSQHELNVGDADKAQEQLDVRG